MDIDKDDFPSEQANGDTGEDTALQLPPEVQTIAGASELTGPARMLSENRKEPVQSAITVPQEVADSQNSAFSEFFDETTDRISGTEHSRSPIFFLIPACLLLLSAGVFFLRRRRK